MKTIEVKIEDRLLDRVQTVAMSRNRTIQELLIEMLKSLDFTACAETVSVPEQPEYDPITPLIGKLDLNTCDLAENHDRYITD
jgi:hypothetical protein